MYLVCSEKEVRCERADPYGGRYHALPPTPESHPASPDSGCPAQDTVKEEEEEEEEGGDLVVHLYHGEPSELEPTSEIVFVVDEEMDGKKWHEMGEEEEGGIGMGGGFVG